MGFENQNFEFLARKHMDALYTRAIQLEPDMQRVEDLVQKTYLKAFQSFSAIRRDLDFKSWLLGILDDVFQSQNGHLCAA